MRTLIIGLDSGTQSTKALVMDAQTGKVLASGAQAYELIPDLPPGAKEQHPQTWRDAAGSAMRQALRAARASAAEVKAIGGERPAAWFCAIGQCGRGYPPGEIVVRYFNHCRVRRNHRSTGRGEENDSRAGKRGIAGLHRAENFVAQETMSRRIMRGWRRSCCRTII